MPRDKRTRKLLRRYRKIDAQGEAKWRWARERKFAKSRISPGKPMEGVDRPTA